MLWLKKLLRQYYFRFRQWYPVWFYLVNRHSRRCYRTQYITPHALEQKILTSLRRDGLAVTSLVELFPNTDWLSPLKQFAEAKRPQATPQPSKPFLLQLWDNKNSTLDFDNPFLSFALDEKIIRIVNQYLKLCSRFYFFEGSVTLPVKGGVNPEASQRWHRDPEDTKMCKVFVYLNDVDETAGPFHYLLGSQFGGRYQYLFPQRPPAGSYPPSGGVEQATNSAAVKVCTGRAGTVIFCDTAGLHRGGYATGRERWMLTAGYSSPQSLWPSRFESPKDFQVKRLTPIALSTLVKR